ncbi:MAG TPA: MFS transporter [Candidatus Acidoferrum sp.]|nr:MFS transporter [Candidatus Acidoferrum sp.]
MAILRAYGSLLVDRALIRLLVGEFVSSIGDWLYLVALLVIVYDKSNGDTVLLGVVGAARILPYVLLSVPAGIAADRFDRRLILLSTDLARGAIMLGLAAAVWFDGPLWVIVALSILATCFSSFFGPTIGAFLPSLVGDESRLGPANSAWASLDNLAFIVGPAVGGLLIAASGLSLAFLLNAVSFGLVAVVLWRLPSTRGARPSPVAATDPPPEEAAAATRTPVNGAAPSMRPLLVPILGLGLLNVVGSFAFGGLSILTVVLAGSAFGGEEATGYLNAAIGVGGLIGAVIAGALVLRPRLAPPLLGGAALIGAGFAALGLVGSLGPALIAMAVASAGSLLVEVVDATIFQRVVPDAVRGRALGGIATAATLALAAGSFAYPVLAGTIGTQALLIGSGVAVIGAALVAAASVGAHATRAEGPDEALLRHVAGLPVFAGVAPGNLEAVLARRHMRDVKAGEVVIRQGDEPDRFAIIVEGRFDVTRHEPGVATEQQLRTMGPDEMFGEIGLLTRVPRTATVTAATDGRLLELDGADFLELVAAGPGLSSRFLDLHRGGRVARPTAHG